MNPWNTLKLLLRPVIGLIALARAVGYTGMYVDRIYTIYFNY